ncbi:hypothetical protein MNBD_GAMMA25-1552 [hydrothermal vent metagenome]|uniref:Cytochrome c-552/4 domain-containing protein n=1 Tax=hydrothermal vent metagenome TaxID=652676 RepID=A0A3B1BYU5_9ZZZZ
MKFIFTSISLLFLLSTNALATFTLVYTGNLNGELEPCGCTIEGDMGGIKRHATMIDQLRDKNPQLMFISSGGLLVAEMPSDKIRSRYILSGMKFLNYDVIGVQARDLAFGAEFLTSQPLPFILSNTTSSTDFAYSKTLQRHSQSFSFFQYTGLPSTSSMDTSDADTKVELKQLNAKLEEKKQTGKITVVTTNLRLARAKKTLPLNNIDLLIVPSRQDNFVEPMQIDNTLLLQPGARGMRFGQLQFDINKNAADKHIINWKHQVIPLPQTVADAPRTKSWYAAYNAELKTDYEKQVALRAQLEQGKSPYAGADVCRGCHPAEFEIWQTSQHALAYEELEAVGKVFDPNCIGCHSLGFNQPGGFLDAELTPHLINVQCESCHGAAQAHVEQSGKTPTANQNWGMEKMCGQCHVGSHSPSFKVDDYWPKIVHGAKTKTTKR